MLQRWICCLIVVGTFAANQAAAQTGVALTTASPAQLGTVNFENDSLVGYNPATNAATLLFNLEDEFGISRNMDAVHERANGNLVISTQAGDTIGGVAFTDSDLVELDRTSGTASLLFDASEEGLGAVTAQVPNIDAVHILDNDHILLSTLNDATFGGTNYDNADVMEFDPAAGTMTLFFDGSLIAGDDPNVIAFTILDDNIFHRFVFLCSRSLVRI